VKKIILACLLLLLTACAQDQNQDPKERPMVVGYNKALQITACGGLLSGEACPLIGSKFTDDCSSKGFTVSNCGNCEPLCSGNPED
jgi:hypothetical protein